MIFTYLCSDLSNDHFGYGETPEEAFQAMLNSSGDEAHDIDPHYIRFWQATDLQVVIETKIMVKNSTGE